MLLTVDDHPTLDLFAFVTTFPVHLGNMPSAQWLTNLFSLDADAPLARSEGLRTSVRDLLRFGGYKPTGRGKPASEYLVRAAGEGKLGNINLAVDACNVASLNSGLPISVIDLDRAHPPFHVGLASPEERYVFNASGQEIKVGGLLCLYDVDGPCANPVKDAQRTKTGDETRQTLSLIWGTNVFPGRAGETTEWYQELLSRAGAETRKVWPKP